MLPVWPSDDTVLLHWKANKRETGRWLSSLIHSHLRPVTCCWDWTSQRCWAVWLLWIKWLQVSQNMCNVWKTVVVGVRSLSANTRSSLFLFCTFYPDIGVGSDSVCARHSSAHRIKSFESLSSQALLSRSSKLLQNQFRSLVSSKLTATHQQRNLETITYNKTSNIIQCNAAVVRFLIFSFGWAFVWEVLIQISIVFMLSHYTIIVFLLQQSRIN